MSIAFIRCPHLHGSTNIALAINVALKIQGLFTASLLKNLTKISIKLRLAKFHYSMVSFSHSIAPRIARHKTLRAFVWFPWADYSINTALPHTLWGLFTTPRGHVKNCHKPKRFLQTGDYAKKCDRQMQAELRHLAHLMPIKCVVQLWYYWNILSLYLLSRTLSSLSVSLSSTSDIKNVCRLRKVILHWVFCVADRRQNGFN